MMPEPPFGAPVNESVPTVGATVEAFAPAVPFMRHHAVTSALADNAVSAAAAAHSELFHFITFIMWAPLLFSNACLCNVVYHNSVRKARGQ